MPSGPSPRPARRPARSTIGAAIVAVVAAILIALIHQSPSAVGALDEPAPSHGEPRRTPHGATGEVPDGTTIFDDVPAVTHLDADLLAALRQAATDAADDNIEFDVTSGWRSRTYQEQLFREAITTYGSKKEAARWVAVPGTSAHEAGDAIDIGPTDAMSWLSQHGAGYGLCQIYGNEPWHYELRPDAADHGCPVMRADATHGS
jgi:D-alanyl-D-alanine carboxypeptidase